MSDNQECKYLIGPTENDWFGCKLKKGQRCSCQKYCALKGTFTLTDCQNKCAAYKPKKK